MAKFVNIDRESPMLLPYDIRDWVPNDHIVHFILDAVDMVGLNSFKINHNGTGSKQYPPHMMLALLIYCYATGRFSSRIIEEATYSDVSVRYICGGNEHPDHDTICTFRRNNDTAFKEVFLKVLMYAQELGHFKKVGGISVDGTKIKANASKHSAVCYKRAEEMIKQLELEIEELVKKAEEADSSNKDNGLSIPEEIRRRENRVEALKKAREIIEERFEETKAEKRAEYESKMAKREETKRNGKKPRGKEPQPPPETPEGKAQYNFTDPESKIMKAGNGQHYEQCYNAQIGVDIQSMLIAGGYVTNNCNDKNELSKVINSIESSIRQVDTVAADTGYLNEKEILKIEGSSNITVYCAVGKQNHHKTLEELFNQNEPSPPKDEALFKAKMEYRLKTKIGKEIYKKRKQTVEPVFGIIKQVLGFRTFMLRGLKKVSTEFELVKSTYNIKRLFNLMKEQAAST